MVVGSAVTLAVLNVQRAIPSSGMVVAVNVGVYSDAACTLNLTSIDWGSVYPDGSAQRTIYVKNTGNAPITLSMTTTSWNPGYLSGTNRGCVGTILRQYCSGKKRKLKAAAALSRVFHRKFIKV